MKIIVASKNPVKIDATRIAFERAFPEEQVEILSEATPSGVPDQPLGDEQTLLGAKNRAEGALTMFPDVDFSVGLEGGIIDDGEDMHTFAYMYILGKSGKHGQSQTGNFTLPSSIRDLVRAGKELGHASDELFKTNNIKQAGGTIGLLTHNAITRTDYYVHAMLLALIPFRTPDLY